MNFQRYFLLNHFEGNKRCVVDKMKFAVPTIFSEVVLPSADMYSDINLVITWYSLGTYKYATAILIPFLANYLMTWYTWWRIEEKEKKKWTWILALLNIWHQCMHGDR